MRLLYAEDEPAMAEAVVDILTFHKFTVDAVEDGEEALAYAREGDYDGIILDIMEDRIEGLDAGADDYLPKPFAMGELLARVRAMLRRREEYRPDAAVFGDLTLDPKTFALACGKKSVVLPNLEYRLFEALMTNSGMYLSAEQLLVKAWGYDTDADVSTVWVYLSTLRKRLKEIGSGVKIRSKRNIGYMLEAG